MNPGFLYDTCTLQNFASVKRLDLLETRHGHLSPPRVTEGVLNEIARGARLGFAPSKMLWGWEWLGDPWMPDHNHQLDIQKIWRRLGGAELIPPKNGGEAESIAAAKIMGWRFVTDDQGAYNVAGTILGPSLVRDTVAILEDCCILDGLSPMDAASIANRMWNEGREFLRSRRPPFTPDVFRS